MIDSSESTIDERLLDFEARRARLTQLKQCSADLDLHADFE